MILRPMIVPMLQTKGITAYALGSCSGFLTISPTIVCMTPMLPLSAPPSKRPASATQKFGAKPTRSRDKMVPAQPTKMTGRLPLTSLTRPQCMPLHASASEKADMSRPAKKGAFDSDEI
jgi:hypothetical protein